MTVLEMQSCLARLYVSATFRAVFRDDPVRALRTYALTATEFAAVSALDPDRLDLFASTLVSKRRKRFERVYPASFAARNAALGVAVRRYVELHPADPAATSAADVLAFGRFAETMLTDRLRDKPWGSELIRFERLSYAARVYNAAPLIPTTSDVWRPALRPGVAIAAFGYDVIALDELLRSGDTAAEPLPTPTTVIFRPGADEAGQALLRVNDAVAAVLGHCDGSATTDEVVAVVERDVGGAGMSDAVHALLSRLYDARVLLPRAEENAS